MPGGEARTRRLLEEEARAWLGLTRKEYDRAICGMLVEVCGTPDPMTRAHGLLSLVSASLRRNGPGLVESRACCAERLLALGSEIADPTLHARIRLLFLLAWMQLASVVARGPESIATTPDFPRGVTLPNGADPDSIADPALRDEAKEAAKRHNEAVEQWNAKQQAIAHLYRFATLIRAARPVEGDNESSAKELSAAMSLAPGLPLELRQSLAREAADI